MSAQHDLWRRAGIDDLLGGLSRMEFLLRFTLSNPSLTTTIVGTANVEHLAQNLAAADRGPLPEALYLEAHRRLELAETTRPA